MNQAEFLVPPQVYFPRREVLTKERVPLTSNQKVESVNRKVIVRVIPYLFLLCAFLGSFLAQQRAFEKELSDAQGLLQSKFEKVESTFSGSHWLPLYKAREEELIYYKILSMRRGISKSRAKEIAQSVLRHSRAHSKEPELVVAVIAAESNFNPRAVSPTGAVGLMQVMPFWKKDLGIDCDLFDIDCNIQYGVNVLDVYSSRYEDTEYALAAYNRGPLAVLRDVERGKSVGDYYTKRVLSFRNRMIYE